MLTVSDFYISPEYFINAIEGMQNASVYTAILANKIQEYSREYDGKSTKAVFTVSRDAVSDTTAISEDTGGAGGDADRYSESEVEITIAEYGNFEETISGKAKLQTFDDSTAKIFRFLAKSSMQTMDDLFAEKAVEGGTGADCSDVSSHACVWEVLNPDGSHKPQDTLTTNDVRQAVVQVSDNTDPFSDGLFRCIIHHHLLYDIMNEETTGAMSFVEYSKYRQSAIGAPAEYAFNEVGVYARCLWMPTYSSEHVISTGADDGSDAYKTLIFGQNYLGAVFVPTSLLAFADNGLAERFPLSRYMELRLGPATSDDHFRGVKMVPYFVGGVDLIKRTAGKFLVSKSSYAAVGT